MDLDRLAQSYVRKVHARRKALDVPHAEGSYSDVVREAQEICELCLKAVLRMAGVKPPRYHDVGRLVRDNAAALPVEMHPQIDRIARYSFELRRDREPALCGAMDVDPWEDYSLSDADEAMRKVDEILQWIAPLFEAGESA